MFKLFSVDLHLYTTLWDSFKMQIIQFPITGEENQNQLIQIADVEILEKFCVMFFLSNCIANTWAQTVPPENSQ